MEYVAGEGVHAAALVLEGEPGIGKTSLWELGLARGEERGLRVLSTRASEAETGLPFAAVIDLLDGVTDEDLAGVPAPQLHALNVALYRSEPLERAAEPQAISLGLLTALRLLAADDELLVAIDDVQWLDQPSDDALAYVARRLSAEPISFLLARRPGSRSALENAVPGGCGGSRWSPSAWARHVTCSQTGLPSGCRTTCSGGCSTRPWAIRSSPWR